MARFKSRKNSCLDIAFDGLIQSQDCSELVIDFIKYLLYMHQQIPGTFVQIAEDASRASSKSGEYEDPASPNSRIEQRKRTAILHSLQQIFDAVKHVFAFAGPVKEVLIQFGSTPISAKESYTVHFPTGFFEGQHLSYQQIKTSFFRQFLGSDTSSNFLDNLTNLYVHILAPQQSEIHHLLQPNERLHLSKQGNATNMYVVVKGDEQSADLTLNEISVHDISGIAPLETSSDNIEEGSVQTEQNCFSSYTETDSTTSDNYIWYRIVPFASGYKGKKLKK